MPQENVVGERGDGWDLQRTHGEQLRGGIGNKVTTIFPCA